MFQVSLVLLCFSLLLSIIVLFLIFWLGKIHHQVDSISKGWSVYCRLTPNQKTPTTTENHPEDQDTCSPLPLVFFNQQAAGSDIVTSWKHINRAFAYASVRSDVDRPPPKTEETDAVLQVGDNKSDDDSKTQEGTVGGSDVPVASYLQIVGNHSPIVGFSISEFPAKDVKHDKRFHISVSNADDDDNYNEPLEDCAQAEFETMRLVDEEYLVHGEDLKICSQNEANEEHIILKKNDHSEATEGSDTGKSESVVWIEENTEESPEFCNELHNLTNTKSDEQGNGQCSQEMETDNKTNGRVMDGAKLPNENDHGDAAVFRSDESPVDRKKEIPCPGGESERVISTKTRPKGKRRRKKKSVADGIHSDGKNGSETQKGVAPLDNVNEDKSGFVSTQCVEQMDKTGRSSATDVRQTQQYSGEQVKSRGYSGYDEQNNSGYQIVNHVDQFVVNNVGTKVPLTHEYHAESTPESDGKVKPEDRTQEKHNDEYATNEDATERNGSSGIVSQLRDLLKRKSLTDSAHSVDRENKITVKADATESFNKYGYLTVVRENEVHKKYAGEECSSTTTDLEDRQSTAEQSYSLVGDGNDDLYCEISAAAQPGVIYVNHDNNEYVRDGFSDKVPIYANIGLRHGTAKCNGNHALQNEFEFAIYSNDAIDV